MITIIAMTIVVIILIMITMMITIGIIIITTIKHKTQQILGKMIAEKRADQATKTNKQC